MTQHDSVDDPAGPATTVVVVGAGMAGLIAARALRRRGVDVLVLEAAGRPGGRMAAETTVLGSRVDLGGQWIGHGHHRFEALAAELGTTVYPMRTPKQPAMADGDRRIRPAGATAVTALGVLLLWESLARLGVSMPERAGTVGSWIDRVPGRRARRLLRVIASVSTTADLDRLSMRALLEMVRYQGGLLTMLRTAGGAQDGLVTEGAATLTERLAAELGDRVRYDSAVVALHRDETGVTVRTTTGVHRAAKVVVTVPPPMAAAIEHRPALPAERRRLQETTYMGSVYKAIAVYDRPFWRARTHAELMQLAGPGTAVFDTSPPGGPGHLCLLVAGPDARALDRLDADARRAALLGPLVAHLGPAVTAPRGWHEKSWHRDEFVGGGYLALPIAGHGDGTLPMSATPVGHLHWAGTETAREHAGYIEGAIESGERVAGEVARSLGRPNGSSGEHIRFPRRRRSET